MANTSLIDDILRPERYLEVLQDLGERFRPRGMRWSKQQESVPFAFMLRDAARVAKAIASDLGDGSYRFSPVELRSAALDKQRELVVPVLSDLVIYHVVARVLTERIEQTLPESLLSFRPGRSAFLAHRRLASYLRDHRARRREPRDRGLYVLKRDVKSYTDNIDVSEASRLWPLFAEHLGESVDADAPLGRLLRELVRPLRQGDPPSRSETGVPTGSPITPVAANVYLTPLDRALEGTPGAFYARFGDDFLFATPDLAVAQAAQQTMDQILGQLGLTVHPTKRLNLFFNGAGRGSQAPDFTGCAFIEWLGMRATFHPSFGLSADKEKELLADLSVRVRSAFLQVAREPAPEAAAFVCSVVNAALLSGHSFAVANVGVLGAVCTDVAQLKRLDHRIAALVSSTLTGVRAPRCFRHLSYRALRRSHGLVSLCAARYAKKAGGPHA